MHRASTAEYGALSTTVGFRVQGLGGRVSGTVAMFRDSGDGLSPASQHP